MKKRNEFANRAKKEVSTAGGGRGDSPSKRNLFRRVTREAKGTGKTIKGDNIKKEFEAKKKKKALGQSEQKPAKRVNWAIRGGKEGLRNHRVIQRITNIVYTEKWKKRPPSSTSDM